MVAASLDGALISRAARYDEIWQSSQSRRFVIFHADRDAASIVTAEKPMATIACSGDKDTTIERAKRRIERCHQRCREMTASPLLAAHQACKCHNHEISSNIDGDDACQDEAASNIGLQRVHDAASLSR